MNNEKFQYSKCKNNPIKMNPESKQRPRSPIDFSTLNYNQYYDPDGVSDLQMTVNKQPETKYKFELGGLLVYDSKAAVSHSSKPNSPESTKGQVPVFKKDLIKTGHSDYSAFLRMKYHTSDPPFIPEYSIVVPVDGVTLTFDSKFECGNLHKAVKISDYEYMLYVHSDTNTNDQNHWYYYSVVNPRKTSITFKITNLLKKDLLYLSGMKPCVYSTQSFERNGVAWTRDGYNVTYVENEGDLKGLRFIGSKKYYTLSFTYDFKYEADLVYFAYAVPYSYTQLDLYLNDIVNRHPNYTRVDPLCKTLGGNICKMLTITHSIKDYFPFEQESQEWSVSSNSRRLAKIKSIKKESQDKKLGSYKASKHQHKKAVVLTARVHSGETVSSYMMKGAIDYLISSTRSSRLLRKNFVFKIIPMLNPDGCKYGNYRCSLLGIDLNRRWNQPNKSLHPTIYFTKKMVETLSEKHEIVLMCDMHGHTKKRNVFMYGCGVRSFEPSIVRRNVMARVVPYLMSLRNKFFSFKDSHFRMESDRKATARVVLWDNFNISHCYTLEASFYGPDKISAFGKGKGKREDFHMNEADLATLGEDLMKLVMIFKDQRVYMRKFQMTNDYLRQLMIFRGLELANRLSSFRKNKDETHGQSGHSTKIPLSNSPASPNLQPSPSSNPSSSFKAPSAPSFSSSSIDPNSDIKLLQKKLKTLQKANKSIETKELSYLEEATQDPEDLPEVEWESISLTKLDPDSDSGGSDSDCSLEIPENVSTSNTDIIVKSENSKSLISKKSKINNLKFPQNSTPQPGVIKLSKKQENSYMPLCIVSPKTVSPRKSENSNAETPIIPQVFVFPEDKSTDYFNPMLKNREHFHIKALSLSKKNEKRIRSRIESTPTCERYSGTYRDADNEIGYSIDGGKVFGKIGGNKLVNEFFNVNRRINAHSLALSTRFKIDKNYYNK